MSLQSFFSNGFSRSSHSSSLAIFLNLSICFFWVISYRYSTMAKRFYTIYCDESSQKGEKFANFYGGALLRTQDVEPIAELLNAKKSELGYGREVKWTAITSQDVERYSEFIRYYFRFISSGRIKVRIMFTSKRFEALGLEKYHHDNRYFLLYYQFIKHAFGLQYCNPDSIDRVFVSIMLDEIPDTKEKKRKFRQKITALQDTPTYNGRNIFFPSGSISEIDSSKHVIQQGLDIILGSMQFKLNEWNLKKPEGSPRRGKRTIAKEKVYKAINSEIQNLYERSFNIGISTGTRSSRTSYWDDPYRHWIFRPKNARKVTAPPPPT